jgi:PTS system nitrogen regulatory IIA component
MAKPADIPMSIADFLSPADVAIDVRATQKQALLRDLAQRAAIALGLPADDVIAPILKREDLGSTGIGGGIAIPHTRLDAVKRPYALVARLKQPIGFDAIDGRMVDVVVLLLLPGAAAADQLAALAAIARKLKLGDTMIRLRQAGTAAEVYSVLIA